MKLNYVLPTLFISDLFTIMLPADHSLFINCGGGETTVNGETYKQDNDTSSFFTSPNKNWAYSYSGGFLEGNYSSSDYIKNMTCGVSVAEAPLYDRARLSPVSLKYYAFCLREGKYNVTLKFAEIFYTDDTDYTSLRKRAFDIYIQVTIFFYFCHHIQYNLPVAGYFVRRVSNYHCRMTRLMRYVILTLKSRQEVQINQLPEVSQLW